MNTEIKVHTTKDYSIFKLLNGNRDVNQLHVKRLKDSIKNSYLTTIIMVNERFEIIDGQHRYLICKDLELPINYIIQKNYGLREVQILNANMKNWTANDYVNGYCDLGYKDYQVYRDFVKQYGFTNQVALLLLSGEFVSGSSNDTITSKFKEGEFKVKDLDKSKQIAERIKLIEPYYNGYLRRSFIYAIVGMLKKDIFNFEEFLSKLKHQPTSLKDCANVTQYKELIEEIYNYRRREKINLRY
jgi:hypothetical protein